MILLLIGRPIYDYRLFLELYLVDDESICCGCNIWCADVSARFQKQWSRELGYVVIDSETASSRTN